MYVFPRSTSFMNILYELKYKFLRNTRNRWARKQEFAHLDTWAKDGGGVDWFIDVTQCL